MDARLTDIALRDIYESCAPAAFRRARGLLDTDADAWDAVHEVFCRLAEGDLLAAARARPMAYVYRATTNACLNILQARRVRARSVSGGAAPPRGDSDAILARDLLEKLDRQLDDTDRQILILTFHDGLPQEQIAEVLGIWRRTVGRRLSRLRAMVEDLERLPMKKSS